MRKGDTLPTQSESLRWFTEQYPLSEFTQMLLLFIKNTQEIKKNGSTKGFTRTYTYSNGMTMQNSYGRGAPSKTTYFNWFVVNVYYDTDNHALHVAIQDNEEREVLGKNIGAYPELVSQAQYVTPRKRSGLFVLADERSTHSTGYRRYLRRIHGFMWSHFRYYPARITKSMEFWR